MNVFQLMSSILDGLYLLFQALYKLLLLARYKIASSMCASADERTSPS